MQKSWIVEGMPYQSFRVAVSAAQSLANANQALVPLLTELRKELVVVRMIEPQ